MDSVVRPGSHWQYKPKYLKAAVEPISRLKEMLTEGT